jgi:tRNA-2-methylthio-N6-dimethylallyladenosine synthase
MNVYDTERMFDALKAVDYHPVEDPTFADLIILNTCSVREKAEDKAFSMLGRYAALRENNPDLLLGIGGCMATRMREKVFKRGLPLDLVFGPDNIAELPDLVSKARAKKGSRTASVKFLPRNDYDFPIAEAPKDGRINSMVTVMKGCNKHCSFCIVPKTRGREVSKPPQMVVDEVRTLVNAGVREVMLLGQNVNSYGHDLRDQDVDVDFAELLKLVNGVEGLERIRFTTSHPWDATEALARAFGSLDKVMPYLHLPLQSGSDRVLEDMRRGYTLESYLELIERLRRFQPRIALSTDIIVGFPGESDEDFEKTIEALHAVQYDSLFVFKYSSRPGTTASKIVDDVPPEVKQARLLRVLEVQDTYTKKSLANFLNKDVKVLVEGTSQRITDEGTTFQMMGRTDTNVIVNIDMDGSIGAPLDLIGQVVEARIIRAQRHSLGAELIQQDFQVQNRETFFAT